MENLNLLIKAQIFDLTLLILPEELVRTADHCVSLRPGNLLSEVVQLFVAENVLNSTDYQNN